MLVAILYFSATSGGDREQSPVVSKGDVVGWVRSEVVEAHDAEEALDQANPFDDETVLNSVELD